MSPGRNSHIISAGVLVRNFEKNLLKEYPKKYHESSQCGPFEIEHKVPKPLFQPLKIYNEHPCPFYVGFPAGVCPWGRDICSGLQEVIMQ